MDIALIKTKEKGGARKSKKMEGEKVDMHAYGPKKCQGAEGVIGCRKQKK